MSGFAFKLAPNTYLENNPQGFFLVSRSPIRTLRVNESLFSVLQMLRDSRPVAEIAQQHPGTKEDQLIPVLLSLTYRGYCRLEKTADIETSPRVSVIIPFRNSSRDLVQCLESLAGLDYPRDRLEVLAVEDGASEDSPDLAAFDVKMIRLDQARGPGAARNAGAEKSAGDILAFLDADCIADKNWLKETVPFLGIGGMGAVGGFVEGYYKKRSLDRYEAVSSSLNLGPRILFEGDSESNFYVPTCNLLVNRRVFQETGGFKEGWRVGEDVDFCWRMRSRGWTLLYIPAGKVAHKHRNRLLPMLRRRGAYGTSEAALYRSHREKRKRLLIPVWAALSFMALAVAILMQNPYPLALLPIFAGIDLWRKSGALKRFGIVFPFSRITASTLRNHFSFYYFTSFHLVRYYLILLLGLGFLFHPLFFLCIFMLLLTSAVDYAVKKPRLLYPVYLFFYLLEHLAYQMGVFWGCLKLKYFGSYLPVLHRTIAT
jgi:mycofactocin glycosyltransferase